MPSAPTRAGSHLIQLCCAHVKHKLVKRVRHRTALVFPQVAVVLRAVLGQTKTQALIAHAYFASAPCPWLRITKRWRRQHERLFKRFWHASVIPSRKDPFSSDQGSQTGLGLTSTRLSDRPGTSSADVFALVPHF